MQTGLSVTPCGESRIGYALLLTGFTRFEKRISTYSEATLGDEPVCKHWLEHPSLLVRFPSSQSSPSARSPFPQVLLAESDLCDGRTTSNRDIAGARTYHRSFSQAALSDGFVQNDPSGVLDSAGAPWHWEPKSQVSPKSNFLPSSSPFPHVPDGICDTGFHKHVFGSH